MGAKEISSEGVTMWKKYVVIFICIFALAVLQAVENNVGIIPNRLIIQLPQGKEYNGNQRMLQSQNERNDTLLYEIAQRTNNLIIPERLIVPRLNIWSAVYSNSERSISSIMSNLHAKGLVRTWQYDHYVSPRSILPNDAQFSSQWALNNTGANGGVADVDIDATEAWDWGLGRMTSANDEIVIAIVDDGADLSHSDLTFWSNPFEIPGNGVDDDDNGYIDDVKGWNAVSHNGSIPSGYHGTHVCGIAAAIGNNEIGVTGVGWGTKIMPVNGSSSIESVVIEAYGYVLEQRARYNETNGAEGVFVVATNSSFGVDYGNPEYYPLWGAMYDRMGAEGIISVASTANINLDVDVVGDIPTAFTSPFLITVTNMNRQGLKAPGAAYGATTIDLGAPGSDIISSVPNNGYAYLSGTSMSSPHVTGSIAMIYSVLRDSLLQYYRTKPDSLALLVKQIILASVTPTPSISQNTVSGGMLNVNSAVEIARHLNVPVPNEDEGDVLTPMRITKVTPILLMEEYFLRSK